MIKLLYDTKIMLSSERQIVDDIEAHIASRGGAYSEWYVGITRDPEQRLFTDHNVNRNTDKWFYKKATSSTSARNIENYFINSHGTDGGTGGGDDNTDYVYAYRKNSHTRE